MPRSLYYHLALGYKGCCYSLNECLFVTGCHSRAPGEQLGKAEVFQLVDQGLAVIQESDFIPFNDSKDSNCERCSSLGSWISHTSTDHLLRMATRHKQVSTTLKAYWKFRDTMTVQDGIVYKGGQVVVPKKLREFFSIGYTHVIKVYNWRWGEPEMLCIYLQWWRISGRVLLTVICVRRMHQLQINHERKWTFFCWNRKDCMVIHVHIVDYLTYVFDICKLQQTTAASRTSYSTLIWWPSFLSWEFQAFAKA